jgi:hypothetical protein
MVGRASDVQGLFKSALDYNNAAVDQNAQNVSQMHAGNLPWGSFGMNMPFTAEQMPYAGQAMQLMDQQGYGHVGQGMLAPIQPAGPQDFAPQFTIPNNHATLPHYAQGTGGLAGLIGGGPALRWLPPLPPAVHAAAQASGIIGVPQGLWAMGPRAGQQRQLPAPADASPGRPREPCPPGGAPMTTYRREKAIFGESCVFAHGRGGHSLADFAIVMSNGSRLNVCDHCAEIQAWLFLDHGVREEVRLEDWRRDPPEMETWGCNEEGEWQLLEASCELPPREAVRA